MSASDLKPTMSILSYLKKSLLDSEKINIQPQANGAYCCSLEELKTGNINKEVALSLFEAYKTSKSSDNKASAGKNKGKTEKEDKFLSVLICPLVYKHKNEAPYGEKPYAVSSIYPLCLPAILSIEGVLWGDATLSPFIHRRYLSPQSQETRFPEVASVNDQDNFFNHNAYEAAPAEVWEEDDFSFIAWKICWAYAEKLWESLVGKDLRKLEIPNYRLEDNGVLCCNDFSQFSSHLTKLYNILTEEKPSTPLLTAFLTTTQEREKKIFSPEPSVLVNEKFIAQMNQDNPLSCSQNVVMNHFLDCKEDLFLTVNGPPGTGKTALIQSLIANAWVKAALDQTEPPIIVVTSTNNNAVTNVLESFKPKPEDKNKDQNTIKGPLYKRWLPDIHSFGTYCVSANKTKGKRELKPGWLVMEADKNILSYIDAPSPLDVEDKAYFEKACREFKGAFSEVFKERLEKLADISKFLHQQLSQAVSDLQVGCTYQKQLHAPFDKTLAEQKANALEEERNSWLQKHKQFKVFEKGLPFYIQWNKHSPIMRKIFGKAEERHVKAFCLHERLANPFQHFYREILENFISHQANQSEEALTSNAHALATRKEHEEKWEAWCSKHAIDCKVEELSKALVPLRYRIFYLATHYWEAKWLQDMENCTKLVHKPHPNSKSSWLRRAKLSPCFVTTLYMLPRFFRKNSSTYLYNFIDYLIFDEAGQVSTYVAAPSLALAKRAIIVGDTKQLEPVYDLPAAIDKGNCKKYNLIATEEEYETHIKKGLAATYNSLMDRAHYLCDFKQTQAVEESGFFLKEHWRCLPEIASYCNELAYGGLLQIKREASAIREDQETPGTIFPLYPALGYAHIGESSIEKGGSRCNPMEAFTILEWLKRHEARICNHYKQRPLHEIVAIITPFKAQNDHLKSLLRSDPEFATLDKDITIGTVHALQGAERDLIIFSLTYGASDSLYFVDHKLNFFNVAVSRARDSFLVFGNINRLNPDGTTPSGLLARKLFADEANQIVDIHVPINDRLNASKPEFINTLEGHREALKEAIKTATKRLLITSPFISINAIEDDNLSMLIKEACDRDIEVAIITDHGVNKDPKPRTSEGRDELVAAGATLTYRYMHDKVICVDNHIIIIGSFNWLSASRKLPNEERSVRCKKSLEVYEEIQKHWDRIAPSKSKKTDS